MNHSTGYATWMCLPRLRKQSTELVQVTVLPESRFDNGETKRRVV